MGFLKIQTDAFEDLERKVRGFDKYENDFVRAKKLFEIGKVYVLRIMPPDQLIQDLHQGTAAIPVAQAWCTDPVRKRKNPDTNEQESIRFLHTSPSVLNEYDYLAEWLKETLQDQPGYLGGPEVSDIVQVWRDEHTPKNPKYNRGKALSEKQQKNLCKALRHQYRDTPAETIKDWVKPVRTVEKNLYRLSYWMKVVLLEFKTQTNEDGEKVSVPIKSKVNILDFPPMLNLALFKGEESLVAKLARWAQDPETSQEMGRPTDALDRLVSNSPDDACYDIIIEPFADTVGDNDVVNYNVDIRKTPTILADPSLFTEEKDVSLVEAIERGDKAQLAIDSWKVRFGLMTPEDFSLTYADDEDTEAAKEETKAEAADKLKASLTAGMPEGEEVIEEPEIPEENGEEEIEAQAENEVQAQEAEEVADEDEEEDLEAQIAALQARKAAKAKKAKEATKAPVAETKKAKPAPRGKGGKSRTIDV